MKFISTIRTTLVWCTAALLAVLPIVIAADFGGILRWTQLLIGLATVAITLLSLAAYWDQPNKGQLRQHVLLLPLIAWLFFAWFQTLPIAPGIVSLLSPGSYTAYTQWLSGIVPPSEMPTKFSISVAPHDSRQAVAMLALVIGIVFASTMTFCTRARIILLLNVVALGVAAHVGYGLLRLVFPGADLYDSVNDLSYASFGTFVNPNNAALFMNLGLGCSLGLLSWRINALAGQELDDEQFEFNDLVSLMGDRDSMIGVFCAVICLGGLLLCGSRGGIVSVLFGALLAFGWVRQRRGLATLPVVAAALAIAAAILLLPMKLSMKSIERFEFFSDDARTFASDGRLLIWPDGFEAGVNYLPAGSGLSTYAFSHLPYQSGVLKTWAQHADNLWLELFVEQGIVGVALAIVIMFLIVRSLTKLRESPDPIDQGLRTAGWYILGVILCSQFFDCGLMLPANLLLVAVIYSATITRHVSVRTRDASSDETRQLGSDDKVGTPGILPAENTIFAGRWRKPLFVVVALLVVALPILNLPTLRRNAGIESLVRSANFQIESLRTDADGLDSLAIKLASDLGDSPEPQLLEALGSVLRSQARLAEVYEKRPKTSDEVAQLFDETKPATRKSGSMQISPSVRRQYSSALSKYHQSLAVRPLGVNARSGKLYLDFLQTDSSQSKKSLEQLFVLHRNNPAVLLLLGQYAANRDEYELAAKLWRTAAMERSGLTTKAIELASLHDQINIAEVVPDRPETIRLASRYLLQSGQEQANEYLANSFDAVACDKCNSLEEKAACLSLQGDIAYKLERHELAFKQYRLAIDRSPSDAELRLKLIRRLREQNRSDQARKESSRGRTVIPGDKRFDSMIKSIAQDDLRKALSQ
ncbi:O-antigen ligase family protein [Planctomycetes bacterium K23_9]|uniref:O-Antigen ligase n=1 Tax=Stieleria marina TaxID=1930275 RepID=A0A517NYU4_9BACT|nr:O-Antigen ligase [Planctomycetes bacterium K23_9]